ncbi:MAG: hypothetical protein WCL22_05360 [bacterium]
MTSSNFFRFSLSIILLGLGLVIFGSTGASAADSNQSNPALVTKVYPDGTRSVVRWADLGGAIDTGDKHGGPPHIERFNQNLDGLASIGTSAEGPSANQSVENTTTLNSKPLANPKLIETYQPDFLYGRFQIGLTFPTDQSVQNIDGVSTTTNLTFDPGLRGTIEVGAQLIEYLAIEGNIGASWNSCNQGSSAGLFQIPVLLGLLGQYPVQVDNGPRLLPYFGLDAGVSGMLYDSLSFVPQGQSATYTGSPSYLTPVWQLRTGVMIEFQKDWAFVLGYTFLGTWGSLGTSSNIDLGFIGTSSIDVGLKVNF